MTDDKLELGRKRAQELKLKVNLSEGYFVYLADDIHRLLGESTEIRGGSHFISPKCAKNIRSWYPVTEDTRTDIDDNYQGFLIGIREIRKETREEKLEALINELIVSHMPKVPTEPYEKQMAKRIQELEVRCEELEPEDKKMLDDKLSENIGHWDGGEYHITAAIWRTRIEHTLYDTFEIGIRHKDGKFTLLQSDKFNRQSVQEVANAIAMLLSDKTQSYTPEWCQEYFT